MMKNAKFDSEAAKWDSNPGRVKMASDIAQAIMKEIVLSNDMDVLDFGCGTGLLTLALQPFVRSITGADSSKGMLDVLQHKIASRNLPNVNIQYLDPDKGAVISGSYHLVVSSMTFHHIREIDPLLKQFHQVLHPSGMLFIADLDEDGGCFHESNDGVFHFGFDRQVLRNQLAGAGFHNVRHTLAAEIHKPIANSERRVFTVFLMMGTK